MALIILDRDIQRELIRERRGRGIDKFDEVWNGVYVVPPINDNEHQFVLGHIYSALVQALIMFQGAKVFPPINVSDRADKWKKNFRIPDISVFLLGTWAVDKKTHWFGGPDFIIEIITPSDCSRKKLKFYEKLRVREVLLVDRKPWSLELYRLTDGELKLADKITSDPTLRLTSQVLPISLRLLPGAPRPTIEVTQIKDARKWLV